METRKCDSLNANSETVVTRLMFMFALIAELTGRSCFKSVGQTCELCALIEVFKNPVARLLASCFIVQLCFKLVIVPLKVHEL